MRRTLTSGVAVAALTALASAQTVSPAEFATAEATWGDSAGFGQNSAAGLRYLQIHDDLKGKSMTIQGLRLRRDANQRWPFMAYEFNLSLEMSVASKAVASVSANFDENHGASKLEVVTSKTVSFPATLRTTCPAPFEYEIKFDRPFVFDGSNGLCWEARSTVFKNLLRNVQFDSAIGSSTSPPLAAITFGQGCRHSTRTELAEATGTSSMNWRNDRGTLFLDGRDLPPNALAIAVLGFSRTAHGPIPLPFLFPGSASAYSGPCRLYASLDVLAPLPTGNGTTRLTFPVPAEVSMAGLRLRGQYLVPDLAAANAFQLISTNAVEWNWVPPFTSAQLARVNANSAIAASGILRKNSGYVVEFF